MILALGGGGACSLLYGFDGFEGAVVVADGGVDSAPDSSERDASVCASSNGPSPPASADGPDQPPVILAVDELAVLPTAGVTRGLNLDGLCTCPGPSACRTGSPICDADGGVDNAGTILFQQIAAAGANIDDQGLRTGNENGDYAILVRITGWNGTADDPAVSLSVLNGYQLESPKPPKHDGTDVWRIDQESLPDGNVGIYASNRAWITKGVLVADVPQAILKVRVPASPTETQLIRLDLSEMRVLARVVPNDSGFTLEGGLLAGRWPAKNALDQVQLNHICQGGSIYPTVKARVCQALDLPTKSSDDGRDVPCGSVSFGFGFSAKGAKLGGIGTPTETPPTCTITADSCD